MDRSLSDLLSSPLAVLSSALSVFSTVSCWTFSVSQPGNPETPSAFDNTPPQQEQQQQHQQPSQQHNQQASPSSPSPTSGASSSSEENKNKKNKNKEQNNKNNNENHHDIDNSNTTAPPVDTAATTPATASTAAAVVAESGFEVFLYWLRLSLGSMVLSVVALHFAFFSTANAKMDFNFFFRHDFTSASGFSSLFVFNVMPEQVRTFLFLSMIASAASATLRVVLRFVWRDPSADIFAWSAWRWCFSVVAITGGLFLSSGVYFGKPELAIAHETAEQHPRFVVAFLTITKFAGNLCVGEPLFFAVRHSWTAWSRRNAAFVLLALLTFAAAVAVCASPSFKSAVSWEASIRDSLLLQMLFGAVTSFAVLISIPKFEDMETEISTPKSREMLLLAALVTLGAMSYTLTLFSELLRDVSVRSLFCGSLIGATSAFVVFVLTHTWWVVVFGAVASLFQPIVLGLDFFLFVFCPHATFRFAIVFALNYLAADSSCIWSCIMDETYQWSSLLFVVFFLQAFPNVLPLLRRSLFTVFSPFSFTAFLWLLAAHPAVGQRLSSYMSIIILAKTVALNVCCSCTLALLSYAPNSDSEQPASASAQTLPSGGSSAELAVRNEEVLAEAEPRETVALESAVPVIAPVETRANRLDPEFQRSQRQSQHGCTEAGWLPAGFKNEAGRLHSVLRKL